MIKVRRAQRVLTSAWHARAVVRQMTDSRTNDTSAVPFVRRARTSFTEHIFFTLALNRCRTELGKLIAASGVRTSSRCGATLFYLDNS